MSEIDKLKEKITDLEQFIFSQKTDIEMQKGNDLEFLKELQIRLQKWNNKNDWTERDMAFKMVEDWINELG